MSRPTVQFGSPSLYPTEEGTYYNYSTRRGRSEERSALPPLPDAVVVPLGDSTGSPGPTSEVGKAAPHIPPSLLASLPPSSQRRRGLIPMLYAASLEVAQGNNAVQYSSKDIANLLGAAAESLAAELERADLAEADANDAALQLRYVEDKQAATAEALARTRRDLVGVRTAQRMVKSVVDGQKGDQNITAPPADSEGGGSGDMELQLQLGLALDEVAAKERELITARNEASSLQVRLDSALAGLQRSRAHAEEMSAAAKENFEASTQLDVTRQLLASQALDTVDGLVANLPQLAATGAPQGAASATNPFVTPAPQVHKRTAAGVTSSPGLSVMEAMSSAAARGGPELSANEETELSSLVDRASKSMMDVLRDAKRLTWIQPLLLPAHLLLGALGDALAMESANGGTPAYVHEAVGAAVRSRVRGTIMTPL